jgi:MFS transporter, CP family, cyanate transporter
VLGMSIGLLQPALPRVARDTLPQRTALASAIYFNGLVVGGAAGVALTPWLVTVAGPFGWRGVLVGWCALGALGVLGWLVIGAPPRAHGQRRNAEAGSGPRPARAGRRWQTSVAGEIMDALRLPGMAALTVAMGFQSSIYYTFSSWLPSFLIARGWSLTSASLPVAALPLTSVVAGLTAPPIEARIGRRATIAVSGAVVVLGLGMFLLRPDETVWLAAITAGAGTTWAFSVCMAAPAALSPPHKVGVTAGVLLAVGYAEAAIGPFALGTLRDAFGSWEAGWLVALGMALVLAGTAVGIPGRSRAATPANAEPTGAATSASSE